MKHVIRPVAALMLSFAWACGSASATRDAGPVQVPGLGGEIQIVKNRGSVVLNVPAVAGARDYRVYAVADAVKAATDAQGHEHLTGATIQCAGIQQRNQCDDDEVLPITYNNTLLDSAHCGGRYGRTPNVPTPVMQAIEVNGIGAGATLVVEAIDRLCPFPGLHGSSHKDIKITAIEMPGTTEDVTVNGKAYTIQRWQPTFPLRTEAEIVAQYGSMILNGEGWNKPVLDPASPAFPESPYIRIAQPAPAEDPIVLARAQMQVTTLGPTVFPDGITAADYFDDFEDPTDQPVLVRSTGNVPAWMENPNYLTPLYQSKKWNFYDVRNEFSAFIVDRGQLLMVMGDPVQDSMSTQAMYPKRPVILPSAADQYLHVTYEVSHTETSRRYPQIALCGSDQAGQTYVGNAPASAPLPRPGFMNAADTARTSPLGWNCLTLTPRGEGYGVVAGGDVNSHSDTTLRVTVVKTHPPPQSMSDYDSIRVTPYAAEFGPTQDSGFPNTWERSINATKQPVGPWLDDRQAVWLRTKFDVYIRRDRVIVYVNGQQRMCTNFANSALTMAEGALGFWHIMYHSSAEFTEMRSADQSSNPQTGQHYILHNTPFSDVRNWDNVGFHENAAPPAGFDPSVCY